jgi:hypothetical protein
MLEPEEKRFTTTTLAERYGCSKSAMRHRIARSIAQLNRDSVHAIQDIHTKQWTVDTEGVAILDTKYRRQDSGYSPKVVSLHEDISSLHNQINTIQDKIDRLMSLLTKEEAKPIKPKRKLDEELKEYCDRENKVATVPQIRRTGKTWKRQVTKFVEALSKKKNCKSYEVYQNIYDLFKQQADVDLYEMRDTYEKTHKRQYRNKKPSILEAMDHNEPVALMFTDFLNGLAN